MTNNLALSDKNRRQHYDTRKHKCGNPNPCCQRADRYAGENGSCKSQCQKAGKSTQVPGHGGDNDQPEHSNHFDPGIDSLQQSISVGDRLCLHGILKGLQNAVSSSFYESSCSLALTLRDQADFLVRAGACEMRSWI